MHRLLAFYYGSHPDSHGRMLSEMLKQDDDWLEVCHDYIQWLFPTTEHSRVTPNAPVLDKAIIQTFKTDELLQSHLRAALIRILSFYGLKMTGNGLVKGPNWEQRKSNWFIENTHNSLRITRILKCLNTLGMTFEAVELKAGLLALCETEPDCGVDPVAINFWREAVPAK